MLQARVRQLLKNGTAKACLQKLYYLPFYFQAVDSSSAIKSGVQFLSLALPQMVSSIVTSALVTYTGHYVCVSCLEFASGNSPGV